MVRIFPFAASCAGEKSHTAKMADALAEAIRKKAEAEGESVSYERLTGDQLRLDYCRSCTSCFRKGFCPLDRQDDGAMLKQKVLDCDIFLFGTPVYLWEMSGLAKSFLDRISYWTHRYELLGKPCVVFSTTDTSHGPEVSRDLSLLMRFTGTVVVDGGCATGDGIQTDLDETAAKVLELYRNPASGVSTIQQNAFVSRVCLVRKYFRTLPQGAEPADEMKVFKERGLMKHVLMSEAIEDLCERRQDRVEGIYS